MEVQEDENESGNKEGVINLKEQELNEIKNSQVKDERGHFKLIKTLQDAYATVSRIMY